MTDISDYYNAAIDASSVFQDWMTEHPQIQPQSLKEYFSYLKIFPHIFRYKFGAVKFDKILSQDASLEKVWEAQQALLSFNNDDLFSFASAFQYCAPLRGVSYFPQGKQFLFNALIEKIESNKGLYLNNYQISSITRNKMIDLEIKAPDGTTSKVSGHQSDRQHKIGQVYLYFGAAINISIFQIGFVRQKSLIILLRFFWVSPKSACRNRLPGILPSSRM